MLPINQSFMGLMSSTMGVIPRPTLLTRSTSSIARLMTCHLGKKPTQRCLSLYTRNIIRPTGFSNRLPPHYNRLLPIRWASSASSSTIPERILAQKEQTANRNPNDANLQADFYRTLLDAGYPNLVVMRYETRGIASNPECQSIYANALESMGLNSKANDIKAKLSQSSGGNLWRNNNNNGPVRVIVEESTLSMVFKWIRFFVGLGLIWYAGLIVLALVSDVFIKNSPQPEVISHDQPTVKFSDVLGCDEARAELEEIVDFLRDPGQFTALGGKLPKGVLLTGPPGTGKTLLARAVAGEAGVPFFFMSGSEFDEMYVGVGAKRIRELFSAAREKAPAIVFIDELDAIGGKRNSKDQAFSKQTLNQLLIDLDGFSQTTGVIFIAATNFVESLDPALTRPGRFDKIVPVELPDVRGRFAIIKHYLNSVETSSMVDAMLIARGTPGCSGADLQNLVNQAAIKASKDKAVSVDMNHLEWAKDKILMGAERKSMILTDDTRRNTAFHEAGHAITSLYTPGATPLYKATILPRGHALGITFNLPESDKYEETRRELLARLDVCMGGRIAEEILRGNDYVTSGCSSDLNSATSVARAMVTQFGMSDKVGPIYLSTDWNEWSTGTRETAENEIRRLLQESMDRTDHLLHDRSIELKRVAEALIKYETLSRDEIERIARGENIKKSKLQTNSVVKSKNPSPDLVGSLPNPVGE